MEDLDRIGHYHDGPPHSQHALQEPLRRFLIRQTHIGRALGDAQRTAEDAAGAAQKPNRRTLDATLNAMLLTFGLAGFTILLAKSVDRSAVHGETLALTLTRGVACLPFLVGRNAVLLARGVTEMPLKIALFLASDPRSLGRRPLLGLRACREATLCQALGLCGGLLLLAQRGLAVMPPRAIGLGFVLDGRAIATLRGTDGGLLASRRSGGDSLSAGGFHGNRLMPGGFQVGRQDEPTFRLRGG